MIITNVLLYTSVTGNQNKINIQLTISMVRKMIKFFVMPVPQREAIRKVMNLVKEMEKENATKCKNKAVPSIILLGQ